MAGFRTHMTVSSCTGLVYGAVAVNPLGYSTDAAILAAGMTALGGMLPDLDSSSGRPVRELSSVSGAVVPLLLLPRLHHGGFSHEAILATLAVMYLLIRYGVSWILRKTTVHRGMFHSVPAMLIAGGIVFLEYGSPDRSIRLLLAVGVMLGFLSHLVLDEIYSVDFNGVKIRLAKSAGSALKLTSSSSAATFACYCYLLVVVGSIWAEIKHGPDGHWGTLAAEQQPEPHHPANPDDTLNPVGPLRQ